MHFILLSRKTGVAWPPTAEEIKDTEETLKASTKIPKNKRFPTKWSDMKNKLPHKDYISFR